MIRESDVISMPMMSVGTDANDDESVVGYNYADNLTKNVHNL